MLEAQACVSGPLAAGKGCDALADHLPNNDRSPLLRVGFALLKGSQLFLECRRHSRRALIGFLLLGFHLTFFRLRRLTGCAYDPEGIFHGAHIRVAIRQSLLIQDAAFVIGILPRYALYLAPLTDGKADQALIQHSLYLGRIFPVDGFR